MSGTQSQLEVGDLAPWFLGDTPDGPGYGFNTVTGRYVVLGFLPADIGQRMQAIAGFARMRARFNDRYLAAFFVVSDEASIGAVRNQLPGLRWFLDRDRSIGQRYGAYDAQGREQPHWLLLDPTLRVMAREPMERSDALFQAAATLPSLEDYAGVPVQAPVLIVPRVFEPALCRQLIDIYDAVGGQPSGVMRDVEGRTVGVLDGHKSRRDAIIADEALQAGLRRRMVRRLAPEIERVFQFRPTRIERYIVACYDAAEGGFFRPHRDNESLGTAHRRFAVSINLNAEEFEGGDLRFPEFGRHTYRPPTGGAVVFACGLQHEATNVTSGRRYAFLPFLYDEEGARIRAANLAFLDAAAPAS